MKRIIIALTGPAGCGKDTIGDYLRQKHGFVKMAFADALRLEVAYAFGIQADMLQDRSIKETPIKDLALSRCNDHRFTTVALSSELDLDSAESEIVEAHTRQPRSPRRIMQLWGTEYRRECCEDDYWCVELRDRISATDRPVVITDCRFENEAIFLSQLGADIWQINRNVPNVAAHASVQPIPRCYTDRDIDNYTDMRTLHIQIEQALTAVDRLRRRLA